MKKKLSIKNRFSNKKSKIRNKIKKKNYTKKGGLLNNNSRCPVNSNIKLDNNIKITDPNFYQNLDIFFERKGLMKSNNDSINKNNCLTQNNLQLDCHQKIVSNYISPHTNFRGLLVYHSLGSGKTLTAYSVMKKFIEHEPDRNIFFITNSKLTNYTLSEFNKYSEILPYKSSKKSRKFIIYSYLTLYNRIVGNGKWEYGIYKNKKTRYSDNMVSPLENTLIIIDEIHNFVSPQNDQEKIIYDTIYSTLQKTKKTKILVLTGTPIKKQPSDIAYITNILKYKDDKTILDVGEKFDKKFLIKNNNNLLLNRKNISEFVNALKGWVSYFNIENDYTKFPKKIEMPKQKVKMSKKQQNIWKNKRISEKHKTCKNNNCLESYKVSNVIPDIDITDVVNNLEKYAPKINKLIDNIHDTPHEKHFIYSHFEKEGVDIVSNALKNKGWKEMNCLDICKLVTNPQDSLKANFKPIFDSEQLKYWYGENTKNFIILRSNIKDKFTKSFKNYTTQDYVKLNNIGQQRIENLIRVLYNLPRYIDSNQNKIDNIKGNLLKIIIGSRKYSEGISLMNTNNVHILEPPINSSDRKQIIGRICRHCSHKELNYPDDWKIKIYEYFADIDVSNNNLINDNNLVDNNLLDDNLIIDDSSLLENHDEIDSDNDIELVINDDGDSNSEIKFELDNLINTQKEEDNLKKAQKENDDLKKKLDEFKKQQKEKDDAKNIPKEKDDAKNIPKEKDDAKNTPKEKDDTKNRPKENDDLKKTQEENDDLKKKLDELKKAQKEKDDVKNTQKEIDDFKKKLDELKKAQKEKDDLKKKVDELKKQQKEKDDVKNTPKENEDLKKKLDDLKEAQNNIEILENLKKINNDEDKRDSIENEQNKIRNNIENIEKEIESLKKIKIEEKNIEKFNKKDDELTEKLYLKYINQLQLGGNIEETPFEYCENIINSNDCDNNNICSWKDNKCKLLSTDDSYYKTSQKDNEINNIFLNILSQSSIDCVVNKFKYDPNLNCSFNPENPVIVNKTEINQYDYLKYLQNKDTDLECSEIQDKQKCNTNQQCIWNQKNIPRGFIKNNSCMEKQKNKQNCSIYDNEINCNKNLCYWDKKKYKSLGYDNCINKLNADLNNYDMGMILNLKSNNYKVLEIYNNTNKFLFIHLEQIENECINIKTKIDLIKVIYKLYIIVKNNPNIVNLSDKPENILNNLNKIKNNSDKFILWEDYWIDNKLIEPLKDFERLSNLLNNKKENTKLRMNIEKLFYENFFMNVILQKQYFTVDFDDMKINIDDLIDNSFNFELKLNISINSEDQQQNKILAITNDDIESEIKLVTEGISTFDLIYEDYKLAFIVYTKQNFIESINIEVYKIISENIPQLLLQTENNEFNYSNIPTLEEENKLNYSNIPKSEQENKLNYLDCEQNFNKCITPIQLAWTENKTMDDYEYDKESSMCLEQKKECIENIKQIERNLDCEQQFNKCITPIQLAWTENETMDDLEYDKESNICLEQKKECLKN